MRSVSKKNREVNIREYLALQEELDAARKEYGIEEKEGRISKAVSWLLEQNDRRKLHLVNRKKYLLFAVFTGWMGGHRFYEKRYFTAVFYLLLFWTGFPIAMTLVDLLIAIPKPEDENGNIFI